MRAGDCGCGYPLLPACGCGAGAGRNTCGCGHCSLPAGISCGRGVGAGKIMRVRGGRGLENGARADLYYVVSLFQP